MYGYLIWKNGDTLETMFPQWMQYFESQPKTPAEQTKLEEQALVAFNKVCPVKDPARSLMKLEDTKRLFSCIHPQDQPFGFSLWLAHYRLPKVEREARTARIEKVVADHFGEAAQDVILKGQLSLLKAFGTLAPDALLETDIRGQGGFILARTLEKIDVEMDKLRLEFTVSMNLVHHLPESEFKDLRQLVWRFVCMRSASQREAAIQQILVLFKKERSQLLVDARNRCEQLSYPLPTAIFFDALGDMVTDALASDARTNEEIVGTHMSKAIELYESLRHRAVIASVEAVAAGVSLGDQTEGSRTALLECNRQIQLQNRKRTCDAARIARARKTGAPIQLTEAQQAEAEALQSWPLQQLAQWIEGPITEKRQVPGPINRPAILKKVRPEPSAQKNRPQPNPAAAADSLTAEDVDITIQQALAASAVYFLAEIGDLLVLAKQLQAHPELVAACTELTHDLSLLANTPALQKETPATALFVKAEAAIRALRAGLKSAESSAKLLSDFGEALMATLRAEPLVLGKRQGGKVACAVRAEDWTSVCNNFHDRWLPQVTSVLVGGLPMQLQNNQAVALYVTGSSQSGYAFDVSVHLWQRRQGKLTKPSDANGLLPPMNPGDWFDTYVTCCVLHVPSAD